MLRCFTLPTACQTAWCRVHQVMLFDLFFMMLSCLVFCISCCAAGPSHLMSSCLMSPKSCYVFCFFQSPALFDLILLMLHCFTTRPTSCCLVFSTSDLWFLIVWSCLGDGTLLDIDYLMLCYLMSPTSGCAFWSGLHGARLLDLLRLMLPLDLPCVMLCCLTFSKSCYATRSGLHNATLLHATLLNLPYRMLCFLVLPVSCCAVWSCHQDGTLLDLFYLMLPSWPSFVMLLVFSIYIVEFFVWSSCCYAAWPSLPLVRLLGLLYLMWCCLMCSVS